MPTETPLDAINEALGLQGEEAHEEPEAELETELPEGEESTDEPTGEGDAEGEGEVEGEGEGEGEETAEAKAAALAKGVADGTRNPDGTFKKKEAPPKVADPINDPIPKDLKKETSERMQSLIKIAKDVTTERDQYRNDFDTIVNGIKASGSTPEQYGEVISWMSLFNSQDPAARTKAYELVNDVADRLATLLNIDRTVSDPLKGHDDLKAAVTAGQVALPYAKEIARTRNATAFRGQLDTTVRTQQQTQAQAQTEYQNAKTALNTFETAMKASDPLYAQKRDAILPALQEAFKHVPPAQWPAIFENAYKNVRVKPRGIGTPPKAGAQPMRGGKNPAGGQARAAGSALEAMNGALAQLKG